MTNHFVATPTRSRGLVLPTNGDPPDISFALFERIRVEDRVTLARAQLEYQKAVLKAQLALLDVAESVGGF